MKLLNETGRALANRLLRNPQILDQMCYESPTSAEAIVQLRAALELMACLAYTLEHALAFGDVAGASADDATSQRPFPPLDDDDIIAESRWSVTEHEPAS